jgi:uncharacterized protein YqeY
MSVKQDLDEALKDAMRKKAEASLDAIRAVKSALKLAEIDKKKEYSDSEIHGLIQSEIKKRKDSIEQFKAGNRADLADREQAQVDVLVKFLPPQMGEAEIEKLVDEAIASTGAKGPKEMGKVMGALMPKVKGKADGGVVNAIVKRKLGAA